MLNNLTKKLACLIVLSQIFMINVNACEAHEFIDKQTEYGYKHIKHVLNTKPEKHNHDTVGTVMYHNHNGKIYVLIGRDNVKMRDRTKAGRFCAFNGLAKSDVSYGDNLRWALKEESLGLIDPSLDYLLHNGVFLTKKTTKRHNPTMSIYALVPAGKHYFISSDDLNKLHQTQAATLLPKENTKDLFVWLDLEELIAGTDKRMTYIAVHDINGVKQKVRLTRFFSDDFMKHPDLKATVAKLKMNINN